VAVRTGVPMRIGLLVLAGPHSPAAVSPSTIQHMIDSLQAHAWTSKAFGFAALILASVNIFGGFLVTARMLAMYKKKGQ
jgi:NAD/NADP transhydrogenase alpha subunit